MWIHTSALSRPEKLVIERVGQKVERVGRFRMVAGDEMDGRLFNLNDAATGRDQLSEFFVDGGRHVPDHLPLVVFNAILGRVRVEKQRHHLPRHCAELHRLAGAGLGHAIDFGVFERVARIVLDLAGHDRPAPRCVDFVEQRTGRVLQEIGTGALGLQFVKSDAAPALQRIVMPGSARQVGIEEKVAAGDQIEAGALLIGNDHGQRVRELFPVDRVQHGAVERPAPQALVIPGRSRP